MSDWCTFKKKKFHSKVNSFLSVCIFVYSWQIWVIVRPRVVVMFFSPHSWAKGLSLYLQCLLRASERGPARNALCNSVIREVGWPEGGERGVCSETTHSTHGRRAKPTQSLQRAKPDVAPWFMWGAGASAAHRPSGGDVYIATGVPVPVITGLLAPTVGLYLQSCRALWPLTHFLIYYIY